MHDPADNAAAHDRWSRGKMLEAMAGIEAGTNRSFDEDEWRVIAEGRREALKQRIARKIG